MFPADEKMIPFTDLAYQRPDMQSFSDQAKRAKNLFQKWNKAKNLRDASLSFQQIVDEYQQFADLAKIRAALDLNDSDFAREVSFWEQVQPTIHRLIHSVHGWLRQKSSLPELKEFLGANFIAGAQVAHLIHNRQAQDEWYQEQELVSKLVSGRSEGRNEAGLWLDYLDLLQLRRVIAVKQGFADYTEFCFAKLNILSYSKDELSRTRLILKELFAPIVKEILTETLPTATHETDSENYLFDYARDILKQKLTLDIADLCYGLNSLCNQLEQPLDWVLKLERASYIDLQPDLNKAEGVECFYLPKVKKPFLFANATAQPAFLIDLVRELGCAYAYLLASSEHEFTPFIEMGLASREFAAQAFAYLAQAKMQIFYGLFAEDAQQWQMRMSVMRLYFTCMLDEFQARVYDPQTILLTSRDLLQQWQSIWSEYFPFLDQMQEVAGFSSSLFDHLLLLNQPGATAEILAAQLAALQFWDLYRKFPLKGKEAWEGFCRRGSQETFFARIEQAGLQFPLRDDVLKRIAYQVAYFMGY